MPNFNWLSLSTGTWAANCVISCVSSHPYDCTNPKYRNLELVLEPLQFWITGRNVQGHLTWTCRTAFGRRRRWLFFRSNQREEYNFWMKTNFKKENVRRDFIGITSSRFTPFNGQTYESQLSNLDKFEKYHFCFGKNCTGNAANNSSLIQLSPHYLHSWINSPKAQRFGMMPFLLLSHWPRAPWQTQQSRRGSPPPQTAARRRGRWRPSVSPPHQPPTLPPPLRPGPELHCW